MTEEQLTRLLRRLAVVTRQPRSLSAMATPAPPNHLVINTSLADPMIRANKYRFAIILVATGGSSNVWFGTTPDQSLNGIFLNTAIQPLMLTYNDIGAAILSSISAKGSSMGAQLNWQEFITPFPLDGMRDFSI